MKRMSLELAVGFFLVVGLVCSAFLAVKLGGKGELQGDHYVLKARFGSTSGLKRGADVEMAGVGVGKVISIQFDPDEFESVVELSIPKGVEVQEDAFASVRSTGIIGGKFLKVSPGGSDVILEPGETIVETESSVSLEELISKYIFESGDK